MRIANLRSALAGAALASAFAATAGAQDAGKSAPDRLAVAHIGLDQLDLMHQRIDGRAAVDLIDEAIEDPHLVAACEALEGLLAGVACHAGSVIAQESLPARARRYNGTGRTR